MININEVCILYIAFIQSAYKFIFVLHTLRHAAMQGAGQTIRSNLSENKQPALPAEPQTHCWDGNYIGNKLLLYMWKWLLCADF